MIDRLINKIIKLQNPTCVGLDTDFEYLPVEMKEGVKNFSRASEMIFEFNKNIIDAVADIVPAVKVQAAYYEKYGYSGMKAFYKTLSYAHKKGLMVIADGKRNDIGSTAKCYSAAYLGRTQIGERLLKAFPSDMLTVNGYLGADGIQAFAEDIKIYKKTIFVLVKTSNPSSSDLQDIRIWNGQFIYEKMGALVEEWGKESRGRYGYSEIGAVVGATHPEEISRLRMQMPHTFFLIPGYGAQGGTAEDIRSCFLRRGLGGIVNSSRGIICAYKKPQYEGMGYAEAARAACIDMQKDLSAAIGKMGR